MRTGAIAGLAVGFAAIAAVQAYPQESDGRRAEPVGQPGAKTRMGGPGRGGMFEGREGRMGGGGMMGGGEEAMVGRLLANPAIAEKLGLTEEQTKSLKEKMESFRTEMETLRLDLEQASIEQARLLVTQNVDEAAVMAAVEKAGEIRTKIAKASMRQLLAVKKVLTPEQIEKARAMIRERMEKERDHMGAGKEQGERGGPGQWRRPHERGSRGGEEGSRRDEPGERPPSPPPEQAL